MKPLVRLSIFTSAMIPLWVGVASAADPADTATARTLALDGIALSENGKCAEAIDRFERAEKLVHAPTHLARLGACQIEVGRLVAGTETLRKLAHETLPPNAPSAFVTARERGAALLAATLPRLAKLRITVLPDGALADVDLDGHRISPVVLGVEQPVDPGEHVVAVRAPGYASQELHLTLAEAGSRGLDVHLVKSAAAAPPPAPTTAGTPDSTPAGTRVPVDAPRSEKVTWPGWVGVGSGAVVMGLGAVFGVTALSDQSTLESRCPGRVCAPGGDLALAESAERSASLSTVLFVAGGVLLSSGIVWLLASPATRTASARSQKVPTWVNGAF